MTFYRLNRTIKIFFSCAMLAPSDKHLFDELQKQLAPQKDQKLIEIWHDSSSSTERFVEILLGAADLIVLLVSSDYLESKRFEMRHALAYASSEEMARVIPVHLRPVDWNGTLFARYASLPRDGNAVSESKDPDKALAEIAREIRYAIERLARRATTFFHPDSPSSGPHEIPYRPNQWFTDRDTLLHEIHARFQTRQSSTIVLSGPGGIGKTQIAGAYAHHYRKDASQITLWLTAVSREQVLADVNKQAEWLGFSEHDCATEDRLFTAFKRWLRTHKDWLLVLDHLADPTLLHPLVPALHTGHVLITTRTPIPELLTCTLPVQQLTFEDGALFLLRRAGIITCDAPASTATEAARCEALEIAHTLGGFPLALDLAGASIAVHHNLFDYRQHYETLLLERDESSQLYPDPLAITLRQTFAELALTNPSALMLLHLLIFLHPESIPIDMIVGGAALLDEPLRSLAGDAEALEAALISLSYAALILHQPDRRIIDIHRLIQLVLREELFQEEQQEWACQALRLVNHVFPTPEFSNWHLCERYFLQAQQCATHVVDLDLTQNEASDLLQRLGSYCKQRGWFTKAEKYLTDALQLRQQSLEETHPKIAETLNRLGDLYHDLGAYTRSEQLLLRALQIREQHPEIDQVLIAQTLNNLGTLYYRLGHLQTARRLLLRAFLIDRRTLEPQHPDGATTFNNLALIYEAQGRYRQASVCYQRALNIYQQTLDADDPAQTETINNLADLYEQQLHDYTQAEALYQRALSIREKAFGDEHPDVATSLNKLAGIYTLQQEYDKAEPLYQRALKIYEHTLDPNHPDLAVCLNDLALHYDKQGNTKRSETLYLQALAIYEQNVEEQGEKAQDSSIITVLTNLGLFYQKQGEYTRAELFLQRAQELRTLSEEASS